MTSSPRAGTNRLLAAASAWGLSSLDAFAVRPLPAGEPLCAVQDPIDEVLFVRSGVVALLALTPVGRTVGAALVGAEGALGATIALGMGRSPWDAVVAAAGEADAMPAPTFRTLLGDDREFGKHAATYARLLFEQSTQAISCARYHALPARTAKWLLALDDHAEDRTAAPTLELLATLLDAPREAVAQAVETLAAVRAVELRTAAETTPRGDHLDADGGGVHRLELDFELTDRAALARAGCECVEAARG